MNPLPITDWKRATGHPSLGAGHVHLWNVPLSGADVPALGETLSPAEWIRAERFHFSRDREHFIAGRGILRRVLGRYLSIGAREIRFATGPHGKPELDGASSALRFNLSHSGDLMLLAVTHARELGVDLEFMRQDVPCETLADHYFDPEDAWGLRLLPAPQRAWKFYDIWTSTEARLKAGGTGLANGTRVVEPDRWSLLKLTPAAGYAAALAVEGGRFQLECWSWRS